MSMAVARSKTPARLTGRAANSTSTTIRSQPRSAAARLRTTPAPCSTFRRRARSTTTRRRLCVQHRHIRTDRHDGRQQHQHGEDQHRHGRDLDGVSEHQRRRHKQRRHECLGWGLVDGEWRRARWLRHGQSPGRGRDPERLGRDRQGLQLRHECGGEVVERRLQGSDRTCGSVTFPNRGPEKATIAEVRGPLQLVALIRSSPAAADAQFGAAASSAYSFASAVGCCEDHPSRNTPSASMGMHRVCPAVIQSGSTCMAHSSSRSGSTRIRPRA